MPTPEEILRGLTLIATRYMVTAMFWHIAFIALALFLLLSKQKISNHFLGYMCGLLLVSVSIFAWVTQNPFNGLVFLIAGLLFVLFTAREKKYTVLLNSNVFLKTIGALVFLSGFFYPHFLGNDLWVYLFVAPVGLVPCPTLLTITGFTLMSNLRLSKSWLILLTSLDLFYGLFGVLKLKVNLDSILILATIFLLIRTITFVKNGKKQGPAASVKIMTTIDTV